MKNLILFFIFSLLLCSCKESKTKNNSSDSVAASHQQYSIEQFLNNTNIYARSFSHDEKEILVGSNESGIYNAYLINLESGKSQPLTESKDESVWVSSLFPNDSRMIYTADNGGNEIDHIFLRNEDGSTKELTPDEGAKAGFYGWSDDLKSFFFGSNKRDKRYMDVYEMDIENFDSKLIYKNTEGYDFDGISNNKQYIAVTKSINTNDVDLFLLDTKTNKKIKINKNLSGNSSADFSVDSKSFYYLTNDGSEFQYLMKYDIENGEREKVIEEDWDISYAYFSKKGKYRVVGINQDAKTIVKILDTSTDQDVAFPDITNGDISSVRISRSEDKMIFSAGSSKSTNNLYLYDFGTKEHKQLTKTLNIEINPDDLVEAEIVRYESFDNLQIPAIYYKPKSATKENKVPALVWVHGGPGGQSRTNYSSFIQYLVNHGYAVLAVNNRGSSGYGKTFFKMDDLNHGENDLQDCIEGKRWLAQQPYIDGEKIGIIGGSYGGFMTMRAMTHTPEEFVVGVNLFGVTNWLRTLKNIPTWWESFKEALYLEMGDPNTADSTRLYDISPVFHGDKVKNPVMVLQGATDPRVLQVESDEMVAAIKKNNIPVEYVLFEDEGHGFVKKENQIIGYGKALIFLDKYLKNKVKG
jgi:dipeptidyl aminopeptidase/acylaminoacyl peptidase